jgi:hypothetical protein
MSTPFKVDDRVRARTSSSVAAGTLGSVREILRTVRDMYYVQFDGHDRPTLMHAADLDRVKDAPAAERTV